MRYDGTYFYSRWALQVTEAGEYDAAAHEFRTVAFIPKEDGVHDESVHSIMRLIDRNRIEYQHFSRHSDEAVERMDVSFALTRES